MTETERIVPELRFKGFIDDWEQRKLGDTFEFSVSTNSLSRAQLNYEKGNIKSIHYGDILIKYNSILEITKDKIPFITDGSIEKYKPNLLENGDVVFADAAEDETVGKAVEINGISDEYVVAGLHTIVARPKEKMAKYFSGYYINADVYQRQLLRLMQGTKVSSISKGNLKKTIVAYPKNLAEQQKIGSFFKQLDNAIALHQRKVTLLKRLKEAYLTRMLPQNSENIPLLRFADYFDPWEQRKFEDLAESFNYGLNASAMEFDGENKYIRITDIDEYSHRFIQSGLTSPNTDLSNANDYLLKEGDILFARTGASVGKSYQYDPLDGKVYYAGFLIRARIKPEFDSSFIFQNTLTEKYNNFIKITSQRSGQPGVNAQEYANFSIMVPSRGEQVKLGNFFKQLDNAIDLHQRQLDNYKELKKAMMQNIFNKKLRFKNGNGNEFPEWKKKKLNNFCSVTTGKLDANAMKENGVYKFFTCSHQDYLIDTYAFEGESLIIAGNGDVGHIKYYNGKFNAYQRTYILQNFENISAVYLKNNLENELPRRIQRETQQSAMVYIKLSTLTEAEIDVPIMEEQNIIGDFLSKFDSMIAKQEKIIDLFKEQKKVLMQKMFV